MSEKKAVLSFVLVALVIVCLAVACGGAQEEPTAPPGESGGDLSGEELLEARCTQCHGLDRVEAVSQTEAEWKDTVESMIDLGAELTDAEAETLVQYLTETYGP
jgi:hypothetical protein